MIPFDRIPGAIAERRVDAGLIIHAAQTTYRSLGLHKIVDLGEWRTGGTGLPLPLCGNVVRKDLGPDLMRRISRLLHESFGTA